MNKHILILASLVLAGCSGGSDTELSTAENKKMQDDLKGGMDLSKATPEQKAGFDKYMKGRGGAPSAPSAPSGGG